MLVFSLQEESVILLSSAGWLQLDESIEKLLGWLWQIDDLVIAVEFSEARLIEEG